MRPRGVHVWIGLISALAVGLLAIVDLERTSPGPLSTVHGREDDLSGRNDCAQCHGGWFSDLTTSCLECHADIGEQFETKAGLHGRLGRERAASCGLCHAEHHGAGAPIVNRQSFARAGVPDPAKFDHDLVGFEMNGAHAELACSDCHTHADEGVLEKGAKRYLGLRQDCASCHEDPHEGKMVVACASCHGQETWDGLHSLGHEEHLPLVGGHANVSCRACHAQGEPHSLELLGESKQRPRDRECADCHASPHTADFTKDAANAAGLSLGAGCVACHLPLHTDFRDEPMSALTTAQHAASGFVLDLPHDKVTCAQCHDAGFEEFKDRYPDRGQDQCSACHADVHAGQFATGPFAKGDCLACHERTRFEPNTFTIEKHALSAMPLTGKHVEADCHACHVDPPPDTARVFQGTQATCDSCHADAHDAAFAPVTSRMPALQAGECARCHDSTSFASDAARKFDHGLFTGFAVRGAHEQEGCEACHLPAAKPDANKRSFGHVEDRFGAVSGCVTCHRDPHQGGFDVAEVPTMFAGKAGCARCHDESSFRALPNGFDHGLWTDFALTAEHASAKCEACHAPLRKPDGAGRTWGSARGTACSDCHPDPHAGQFAHDATDAAHANAAKDTTGSTARVTDCARCHVDDRPAFLSFDHDRDSRFALGDQHVGLDCGACHKPSVIGGESAVRYKPLGTECVDCHGVQEDVLMRRNPRRR